MRMISVTLVLMVLGALGLDTCGEGKSQCTQGLENDARQNKNGKAPIDDVNEVLDKSFLIQSKKVQISEEVEDGLSTLAQVASRGEEEIQEQVIEDKGQGSGSGAYMNAGSATVQVSRHLASHVVNPGELLHCDDCIMKFNASGGCDIWRNQAEVDHSCLDLFPDACARKAITFCAAANEAEDEGEGMVLLEQREVKDDQSAKLNLKAASLLVRSTSSLGSKAGGEASTSVGRELGKHMIAEVLGESITNSITGALAQIPGIHTVPFVGDFLGLGPTQDMTNQGVYDALSGEIKEGFKVVNQELTKIDGKIDALGTQVGNLKTQMETLISGQTDAINGMITTSTKSIITSITVNAQANLRAIQSFRQQAQRNHDASMNIAREAMFDSHHRQCLEYTTSILAKYGLYELVLSSALEVRQGLIDGSASEWTKHTLKFCGDKIGSTTYNTVDEAKRACLTNSMCFGVYVNGFNFEVKLCDAQHVDAGSLHVSGASWVFEKGPTSKNEAMLALKESQKLFDFLSGTGMGTVVDFQQLYVCVMPTPYTESLLAKFIRLKTSDGTNVFSSQNRKAALELASDFLDTGKMSYDMQDMQLLVVDHLEAASRAEFAIKVGSQLTAAFSEFRTTIHNAQADLSFLDFTQWPNTIIIEYGYAHDGTRGVCPGGFPGGFNSQGGVWAGVSENTVRRSVFERLCQETIEACVTSETCNEALVWATVWTGEYGDRFDVSWYTQLATTPKGFGCLQGSSMSIRHNIDSEGQYGHGAFAAFLILQP